MFTQLQEELRNIEEGFEQFDDVKSLFNNDIYYLSINSQFDNDILCIRFITMSKNFKYMFLDGKYLKKLLNHLYKFVNLKYFEFTSDKPVDINLIMTEVTLPPSLRFIFVPETFYNIQKFNGYVFTRECKQCMKYNLYSDYGERYDMLYCLDGCSNGFMTSLDAFKQFEKSGMKKFRETLEDVDDLTEKLMSL